MATRFDAPDTVDSLTHRVVSTEREGDGIRVETKGDANDTSEVWAVPADTRVGVVEAHVPLVGRPATLVRTSGTWMAVAAVVLGVVVLALLVAPRLHRRTAPSRSPLAGEPHRETSSS